MGYILAIVYFSGQTFYKHFPDLSSCRNYLLEAVDNGNYKKMRKAECNSLKDYYADQF